MPIFTFRGVDQKKVEEYFLKVGEIAQIINGDINKFVFWYEPTILIGNGYEKDSIFISIDWVGRPLKQERVAKHIQDFFKNESNSIYVKFTEINNFMYLNGVSIG